LLSSVQSLGEDAPNLGNRALMRATQGIIDQIRRILHGRWDDSDLNYLKVLQKVGVALCKAIDEKDDIATVVSSVGQELEQMLNDMEVPVNNVGNDEGAQAPEEEPLAPGMDINA